MSIPALAVGLVSHLGIIPYLVSHHDVHMRPLPCHENPAENCSRNNKQHGTVPCCDSCSNVGVSLPFVSPLS
jgi:hypothetical protein